MPSGFDQCVRLGGKVRTKSSNGTYRHYCIRNGKVYVGETKTKKEVKK